jgi:hypothetical protein
VTQAARPRRRRGPSARFPMLFVAAGLLLSSPALSQTTSSETCFRSMIRAPAPFLGNHGEIFRLANGTIWEVQFEYNYLYEYYPAVIICPAQGLAIVNQTRLVMTQRRDVCESCRLEGHLVSISISFIMMQ